MNKHHREDHEMKHGARHREKKKMSHGGMVGEKVSKTSGEGSSSEWASVNAMLMAKHPTTNLATAKCGGMKALKMAAGGVAKVRKGQYD